MTVRCDTSVESSSRLDLCAMPLRESTKARDDAEYEENQRVDVDRIVEKRMLHCHRLYADCCAFVQVRPLFDSVFGLRCF
mmetsp:Transcript_9279/g.21552  ORF Transcript_9279/g.21552 Transcript_9279/m.21552 type:complete len:80 (+) Transcript_9279:725-964(+)